MMGFDPKAYLAKKTQVAQSEPPKVFNPKAYLASKQASPEVAAEPEARTGEAIKQGAAQGLLLGYLPQVQSAIEGPAAKVYDWANGTNVSEQLGDYTKRRDDIIKDQEKLAAENPKAYMGGQIGGGIASFALAGAASAPAKAASVGQRFLQAGTTGAKLGLISNPGDKEGEVGLQPKERVMNTGIGAVSGLLGQAGGEAIDASKNAVSGYFKKKAQEQAFKAMGPYARDTIKAFDKNQVHQTGQVLIDEGVVGGVPTNLEKIGERANQALDRKGKAIDGYLNDLSKAEKKVTQPNPGLVPEGTTPPITQAGVNRKQIADSLRQDLIVSDESIPGAAAKNQKIHALINEFESGNDSLIPALKAEQMKRSVGKEINWDRLPGADIPLEEQVQRGLYGKLKTGVEDAGRALEEHTGRPVGQFKKMKDDYGALERGAKMAGKREAKEFANRFLSPSDYLTGGVGAAAGFASGDGIEDRLKRGAMGFGVGLLNKGARTYGNQINVLAAKNAAALIKKFPDLANNPAGLQAALRSLQSNPGLLKKEDAQEPPKQDIYFGKQRKESK